MEFNSGFKGLTGLVIGTLCVVSDTWVSRHGTTVEWYWEETQSTQRI